MLDIRVMLMPVANTRFAAVPTEMVKLALGQTFLTMSVQYRRPRQKSQLAELIRKRLCI